MKVISLIKKIFLNYISFFRKQTCPWCNNRCISFWQKIRLSHNNWDMSSLRKRECPVCKKKLTVKDSKITTFIAYSLIIVLGLDIVLSFIDCGFLPQFGFPYRWLLIPLILLIVTPTQKIIRDEEFEERASRQRKIEEQKKIQY